MYSELEFQKLIGDLETEFAAYLGKSEDFPPKKAEKKDEDEKPEAKAEPKQDESKPEAKEDAPAPKQDAAPEKTDEAPAAPADEAPQAPSEEGHDYDEEDLAHMQAMYASMSRGELKAHHDAVRAALDACGMEKCGDMAPDQAAPMQKSEKDVVVEVSPEAIVATAETELLKSEIAAKDAEVAELKKSVDVMTTFITKLFEKKGAPAGKAITSLETIAKSESVQEEVKPLSKEQITSKLNQKASEPTLTKSDREAINQFYATGQININGISHLLK